MPGVGSVIDELLATGVLEMHSLVEAMTSARRRAREKHGLDPPPGLRDGWGSRPALQRLPFGMRLIHQPDNPPRRLTPPPPTPMCAHARSAGTLWWLPTGVTRPSES